MLGLYLFSAVLGVGLLVFSMGDDGDSGHDHDLGVGHGHAGDIVIGFFKPRNLIFFAAAFGVTGSLLTWTGTGAFMTAVASGVMGLAAMSGTHVLFRWLRRSDSSTEIVGDTALEGSVARVTVNVTPESRGRVAVMIGGREVHVIARLAPGTAAAIESGREALVVRMVDGEAEVSAYGSNELSDPQR